MAVHHALAVVVVVVNGVIALHKKVVQMKAKALMPPMRQPVGMVVRQHSLPKLLRCLHSPPKIARSQHPPHQPINRSTIINLLLRLHQTARQATQNLPPPNVVGGRK
jgi:hypothetical protein